MGALVHVADKDVQERDEEEENQVSAVKIRVQVPDGKQGFDQAGQGQALITGEDEDEGEQELIKQDLTEELQEFPEGDGPVAHEITGEQDKTVDAGFSPGTEEQHELAAKGQRILRNGTARVQQAGMDHIMMGQDEQHGKDPEEFKTGPAHG